MFKKRTTFLALVFSNLWIGMSQAGPAEKLAASWEVLLKKHVKSSGAVSYQGFEKDLPALKAWVEEHAKLPAAGFSDQTKKAVYINLYNGVMVYHILRWARENKISVSSDDFRKQQVDQIKIPGGNIWKGDYRVNLAGTMVHLDDIEHGLIRADTGKVPKELEVKFLDPRIHAAVNCAALSCPPLLPVAYTPGNIDRLLDENMRKYVSSNVHFRKKDETTMRANSIVLWYYADFDDYAQRIKMKGAGEYLVRFLQPNAKDRAWKVKHFNENFNDRNKIPLRFSKAFDFQYNWLINDARNYR